MQSCDPQLRAELQSDNLPRQTVELYELFTSETDVYTPDRAIARWATAPHVLPFEGQNYSYERRVLSRGEIRRFLDRQVNTLSLTLDNVDLAMTRFVNQYRLEGMWLQVRLVARSVAGASLILFGGRVDKPDELDHRECRLTVRQDFGVDQPMLPRRMTVLCPLRWEFKGLACRGGVALSTKSPAYQAAAECNGSFNQCLDYVNTDNFQGIRFTPVNGTFSYQVVEQKRFLLFFSRKKKRTVSATWSSVSDFQEDSFIPEVGGLVQLEGMPVMHADSGVRVKFLHAFAGEDSDAVLAVRCRDKQYLTAPDNVSIALGAFGSSGQPASVQFPGAGKFSGVTWVEGEVIGSDPADANDASPTITAVVRGRKYDHPDATGQFTLKQASDVGPIQARWYLLNRGTAKPGDLDDESFFEAMLRCAEPVIDDTGFEQAIIPQQVDGGSIQGFIAYASASGFGASTVSRIAAQMAMGRVEPGGYTALVQAYYRYVNTASLAQYISPVRKIRRRYTSNFALREDTTLGDFLYDVLLPSFNGYLIWSASGQIQVRVDGPADATYLRNAAAASATEIEVEDVTLWQRRIGSQILIGAHLGNSEIHQVRDWHFTAIGGAIAFSAAATGVMTVATAGPDGAINSIGSITLAGTATAGDQVTAVVDGITVDYTVQAGDDREGVAAYLALTINGHSVLRRYLRAEWNPAQGSTLRLISKSGFLTLDSPLASAHERAEETIRIVTAFGTGGERIRRDTFRWPLGSRQSSVNFVNGTFRSAIHDWAVTPIEDVAETHLRQVRKRTSEEINLSAVDNAHQAFRLLRIRLGKRRLCDWFCSFTAGGEALLLDVGDVVCVSHYSGGAFIRNVPVVIEDILLDGQLNAKITARLYKTEVYDDTIQEVTARILLPLQTGTNTNTSPNPPNPPLGGPGVGDSGSGGKRVDPPYGSGDGGYGTGGGGDLNRPIVV